MAQDKSELGIKLYSILVFHIDRFFCLSLTHTYIHTHTHTHTHIAMLTFYHRLAVRCADTTLNIPGVPVLIYIVDIAHTG
jgi:hypothetical protein